VLDHYERQGQPISAHLLWMSENAYTPGRLATIWLPHDGDTYDRVIDVSFRTAFEQAGFHVEVVPNQGRGAAMSRIKAAQRMFPACWFNKETTEPGLDALGWYHERRDDERDVGLGPEHDWSSHSSDAFGMQALVYESRASLGGAGGRRFKRERRGSPMAV
jgi:phage terminase large subunit